MSFNIPENIKSTLMETLDAASVAYKYGHVNSLADYTKAARVEPLTIISRDCLPLEYTVDVLQALLNVFAAYYLQAASFIKINDIRVIRTLEQLNPNRSLSGSMNSINFESDNSAVMLYKDAYKHALPRLSNSRTLQAACESVLDAHKVSTEADSFSNQANQLISEVGSLAVGKIITIDFSFNDTAIKDNKEVEVKNNFTIPVMVRLATSVLSNSAIIHLLALKTEDISLKERWHAMRAGRISFIRDLIFCQDLIDEHRKALMYDQDGVISEITRRANNSKVYGLMSKAPSLAAASNIFVISEEDEKALSLKLGGKLSNPRIRERAFENTYAMLLVVIDREYERVTIYHRGVANATNLSIREVKASNKNKGPDISDLLKSLMSGSAANF